METYAIDQSYFQGPLEQLLALIEERKLEITAISLAEVTEDFLKHVKRIRDADTGVSGGSAPAVSPRLLADFIAIASKLILIKSKSLLPDLVLTEEEEADISELEKRLRFYRELKSAFRAVNAAWSRPSSSFGRPYFLSMPTERLEAEAGPRPMYPGDNVALPALTSALGNLFAVIEKMTREEGTIRDVIMSIEEKISEIVGRLKAAASASFEDMSREKNRAEIIVIFLAILHLAREQLVSIEQERYFSDIIIKKSAGNL